MLRELSLPIFMSECSVVKAFKARVIDEAMNIRKALKVEDIPLDEEMPAAGGEDNE
jgi:hypothetical protein